MAVLAQENKPSISYSSAPKEYTLAGVSLSGDNNYEDYVILGFSGLSIGQKIKIPGDEITSVMKRFWKQGLFSDVKISATKIVGDSIWLDIKLDQRSKINRIEIIGSLTKNEKDEITAKIPLKKGSQLTPNLLDRTKRVIKDYFDDKGFYESQIKIEEKPTSVGKSMVDVNIKINKGEKVRVHSIIVEGNDALKFSKIDRVMKKTNPKGRLADFFRTKKYVENEYKNDKKALINHYKKIGYRDARIVSDSVVKVPDNMVDIYIKLDEGRKYYFGDIVWVGNTVYSEEVLNEVLKIKKGDVYNQTLFDDRLQNDEDAVSMLYLDNGYLFFNMEPQETSIVQDTVNYEIRIFEGTQATINKITIEGNNNVFEHVIRRELRTKPGELFSKSDIMRSMRELAQTGQFDAEPGKMDIRPEPNPEDGTVDLTYILTPKKNDQIELSLGYGQTGVVASVGLKFTNFSIQNIFNKEAYKRIIPQGDAQTLSLNLQTNGRYYHQASLSFVDGWFGGKRPNTFSFSLYYSLQTGVNSSYNNYYSSYYTSGYYSDYYNSKDYYDMSKFIQTVGVAIGFGKRLSWPDDYFTIYGELGYQYYKLRNWQYFYIPDGNCNKLSLGVTLARNSVDNPIYPRRGSQFSLMAKTTPPYSAFTKKNYGEMKAVDNYRWIEFYKFEFKSKMFFPLTKDQKLVLMARAEFGYLGYYNKYRKSPFERFEMGGDGMSGMSYSTYAAQIVGLRGYESASLTPTEIGLQGYTIGNGNVYARYSMELRYPVLMNESTTIYALAFAEAGNCWSSFANMNPFNLKRSVGAGFRIYMPVVGLFGLDWAWGFDNTQLNKNGNVKGSHFHIVLGQEF